MRAGINRVSDNLILVMPSFIHEFGDSAHHMSMVRTCEFDEYEAPIRGTGFSDRRYRIHEFLDDWVFYPIQDLIRDFIGDNKVGRFIRIILGIFWGFNCGFPARDIALYTVWDFRCCPARAVFKKVDGKWMKKKTL
jgi:hypothetical protein